MQSSNYQENLFSTTNTKFAAVLLLFGFRLNHPSQPLEWSLEYPSKEAYIKSRKDPKIKAAHSANVVQCCREVLEAREYLMSILKLVPRLAKPIVVFGKGTRFAKFGGNASKETQITHLDNL